MVPLWALVRVRLVESKLPNIKSTLPWLQVESSLFRSCIVRSTSNYIVYLKNHFWMKTWKMTVWQIFRDFSAWTSAHGIPHIGGAQNVCLRIFWTVIFTVSVGMFTWQMVLLIQKYLQYDVTVQTEVSRINISGELITLCKITSFLVDVSRTKLSGGHYLQFEPLHSSTSVSQQRNARHRMFDSGHQIDCTLCLSVNLLAQPIRTSNEQNP